MRAGINGAGKTTQLQIIAGNMEPTSGQVAKEKPNMRIAYLTQEFDVVPTRTVRVRLQHPWRRTSTTWCVVLVCQHTQMPNVQCTASNNQWSHASAAAR